MKSKHYRWIGAALALMLVIVLSGAPLAIAQDGGPERTGLRPDAPPYAVHGSYVVGTREFVIEDTERPLTGTVWYPSLNPDGTEEIVTYDFGIGDLVPPAMNTLQGHALLNAAPDSANSPYPLVVFSHGRGAGRFMTAYFCEHLASYGFVVIAVEHVGSALRDSIVLSEEEFAANFIPGHAYRPQDIQREIDYAEMLTAPGGGLEGIIDTERIAVSGWSFGGYTALAAAGARLNFDALAEWCAQNSEEDSTGYTLSCSLLGQEKVLADLFGWSAVPEGLWPAVNDPRVDALVALAPGRGPAFGPDGLAAVTIPALVLIGTRDSLDGMEDNAQLAYKNFASEQKSLVVFENADHFIYGQCGPVWEQVIFPMCSDAVWDMARAQDLTNHFTTAFLLATLKDDMDAASVLALDAVQFPGISYETTGF